MNLPFFQLQANEQENEHESKRAYMGIDTPIYIYPHNSHRSGAKIRKGMLKKQLKKW